MQIFYIISVNRVANQKDYTYFSNFLYQADRDINNILKDIERISNTVSYSQNLRKYFFEENPFIQYQYDLLLRESLDYIVNFNSYISAIRVLDKKKRVISYDTITWDNYLNIYSFMNDYLEQESVSSKPFFTKPWSEPKTGKNYFAYIAPIFSSVINTDETNIIGICITIIDAAMFGRVIQNDEFLSDLHFVLSDKDHEVILSSFKPEQIANTLSAHKINGPEVDILDRRYRVDNFLIDRTGWFFSLLMPINTVSNEIQPIINFAGPLEILIVLIFTIIGFVIIKNITFPISLIVGGIGRIGETINYQRLQVRGNNEITVIADKINQMLDRIENMNTKVFSAQRKLHDAELAQKEAELAALQSQINPHFLYNTLECMRSIGQIYGVDEITKISSSLAKVLRYCIKEDDIVYVKDEIHCIKDYFSIIDIRFMGKYDLKIDINDDIFNKKMIKMILQPIVENAIYYGLEEKKNGSLSISGDYTANNSIHFTIHDNGKGIHKDELSSLNYMLQNAGTITDHNFIKKRSIGLVNICKRIKMKYGKEYGVHIDSIVSEGTTVKVSIPAL